jgi:hypothetical protein
MRSSGPSQVNCGAGVEAVGCVATGAPFLPGGPRMRQPKDAVMLTEEERARLRTLVGAGVAPARMLTRARVLLKANQDAGGAA